MITYKHNTRIYTTLTYGYMFKHLNILRARIISLALSYTIKENKQQKEYDYKNKKGKKSISEHDQCAQNM